MTPESRARLLAGFASSLRAGGMVSLDSEESGGVDSKALSGGQSLPQHDEPRPLTPREKRVLFTRLLAQFITWAFEQPGVELAIDEATVHSPRAVLLQGKRAMLPDAVHKQGSFHGLGLAADLNLYFHGQYIDNGDHPLWRQLAEKWESLHPEACSGRRWKDGNHISVFESDKTEPLP